MWYLHNEGRTPSLHNEFNTLIDVPPLVSGKAYVDPPRYWYSGGRVAQSLACKTAAEMARPQAPPILQWKLRFDMVTACLAQFLTRKPTYPKLPCTRAWSSQASFPAATAMPGILLGILLRTTVRAAPCCIWVGC